MLVAPKVAPDICRRTGCNSATSATPQYLLIDSRKNNREGRKEEEDSKNIKRDTPNRLHLCTFSPKRFIANTLAGATPMHFACTPLAPSKIGVWP